MSVLQVQTLQGPTSGANSNTVLIPDTNKLYAKGHVVQVQTYHVASVSSDVTTTSTSFQNSGAAVTITPQFSDSLIVCDFVVPMSYISYTKTTDLKTRLLLNNVQYGGQYTTGYMTRSGVDRNSFQPTTFKTVHSTLSAGTAVEFKVQFTSTVSGEAVVLVHINSSMTMTVSEIAQ